MDKISELIKEARPLYKQRKRRKTIAKLIFVISVPAMLFNSLLQVYIQGCDIYVAMENEIMQNELVQDDLGLLR